MSTSHSLTGVKEGINECKLVYQASHMVTQMVTQ